MTHLDLNGDGFAELVYADSWHAPATPDAFRLQRAEIMGGDYDLLMDNDWRIDGRHAYDYVGSQLSGGDPNSDGYDTIIGAYGDDHPEPKTGSIFVMNGAADTPSRHDRSVRQGYPALRRDAQRSGWPMECR